MVSTYDETLLRKEMFCMTRYFFVVRVSFIVEARFGKLDDDLVSESHAQILWGFQQITT
jgi:hypothetical protein